MNILEKYKQDANATATSHAEYTIQYEKHVEFIQAQTILKLVKVVEEVHTWLDEGMYEDSTAPYFLRDRISKILEGEV